MLSQAVVEIVSSSGFGLVSRMVVLERPVSSIFHSISKKCPLEFRSAIANKKENISLCLTKSDLLTKEKMSSLNCRRIFAILVSRSLGIGRTAFFMD